MRDIRHNRLPGLTLLTVLAALGAVVSGAAGQQVVDCGSPDPKYPGMKDCCQFSGAGECEESIVLLPGSARDIPENTWVTVARSFMPNADNPEADCLIFKGQAVTILGEDNRFGVLVAYTPSSSGTGGTACGLVAFWIAKKVVGHWPPVGVVREQMHQEEVARDTAVDRIIGKQK